MLYDVFIDFWGFFFNSTTNPIPSQWVELLAVGSTIMAIYMCVIYPIVRIFKKSR